MYYSMHRSFFIIFLFLNSINSLEKVITKIFHFSPSTEDTASDDEEQFLSFNDMSNRLNDQTSSIENLNEKHDGTLILEKNDSYVKIPEVDNNAITFDIQKPVQQEEYKIFVTKEEPVENIMKQTEPVENIKDQKEPIEFMKEHVEPFESLKKQSEILEVPVEKMTEYVNQTQSEPVDKIDETIVIDHETPIKQIVEEVKDEIIKSDVKQLATFISEKEVCE